MLSKGLFIDLGIITLMLILGFWVAGIKMLVGIPIGIFITVIIFNRHGEKFMFVKSMLETNQSMKDIVKDFRK